MAKFSLISRGKKFTRSYGRRKRIIPVPNLRSQGFDLRRTVGRSMLNFQTAPHHFKRFTQDVFSQSAGTTINGLNNIAAGFTPFDIQFRLSDLPNSNEITALYDQYMLSKIVIKFIPGRDLALLANLAPVGALAGGRLITVIDNDDATAVTANSAREYNNAKITQYGKIHKRVLVPAVLRQMYESNIATAYTPSFHQWISTTDPATLHFGIKGGIIANDPASTANSITYSIEAKYYFKCKNIK